MRGWRGFGAVGKVEIPYYTTRQRPGRPVWGYWAPCLARRNPKTGKIEKTLMAKLGFKLVDCGEDGPRAWAIAESWNRKWQHARAEHRAGKAVVAPGKIERVYPRNSLGEGFARFRATGEWHKKAPRTREGWMRGWRYIEPVFGDVDPRTVALEDLDLWYNGDPLDAQIAGLVDPPPAGAGVSEAYLAMKYWRAIYAVLLTINRDDGQRYVIGNDPSLGIRRKEPKKREAIWVYDEARQLVKTSWKMGFKGLAAALATSWDTMMSPVDVRSLSLSQLTPDPRGPLFSLARAKTGKAAIGTLGRKAERILAAYIDGLPFTLMPDVPIFHTRGGQPGPKGGRPRPPRPYTKDTLSKDFRIVRDALFKGDTRKVMDFRRSGAVEATAGQVDQNALAGKMANSIDSNRNLQATYQPNVVAVVRLADEARARGRTVIRNATGPKK